MAQNDVNIKIKVDATQANQSTENYKARLKQLKDEMTRLQVETDGLSKASAEQRQRFAQLSAEAGKIQDAMSDTAQQVKNLSDDYKGMSAALQGVQGAVGGITAVSGAMSALGIDSEGASESIKKITALMGIMQGVQQVQKTLNKDSALMTALMTAKNKLLTTSIQQETTAQLALNAAKLGAVGAITALVAAVGVLIYRYASAKSEVAKFNEELNEQAAESVASLIVKINDLSASYTALGDDLAAKEQFIKDNQKAFDDLGVSVTSVNDAENLLVVNSDKFIQAQILRAKATAARAKMEDLAKESLENQLEYERIFVDKQTTIWEDLATLNPFVNDDEIKGAYDREQQRITDQQNKLADLTSSWNKEADAILKEIGVVEKSTITTENKTKAQTNLNKELKKTIELVEASEDEEIDYDEIVDKSTKFQAEQIKKRQDERKKTEKEWHDFEIAEMERANAERTRLETEQQARETKIRETKWKAAENMISSYSDLVNAAMNAELEAVGDNEEEQKKIRRKYAKAQFLSQIASIGISTAKAIMETWAAYAELPFVGQGLAAAQTALIAGVGIAQTYAAKAAMDNAMKAKKGGILQGASHEQGGIMLSNGVEAEGGEAIINKRSTAAFAPLLSQINSFNGYGAPLIQSTPANNGILGSGISETTIQKIVAATVAGVASIPVVVSEHAITETQRIVGITKERAFI
jgi:hypothetical protein